MNKDDIPVSPFVIDLLNKRNLKQKSLIGVIGCKSLKSVNTKFRLDRWTASDLIKVADVCGARLAFILPGGGRIYLTDSAADSAPATPGGNEVKQG